MPEIRRAEREQDKDPRAQFRSAITHIIKENWNFEELIRLNQGWRVQRKTEATPKRVWGGWVVVGGATGPNRTDDYIDRTA